MAAPYELIETMLSKYGTTIYRIALLLAGNERGAEHLIVVLVRHLQANPPSVPFDDVDLIAQLRVIALAQPARPSRPARRDEATTTVRIYQRLITLPIDQRLALGLHLLLGYDLTRLARVLASDPQTAQATLLAAGYMLAPAARIALTNQVSSDQCPDIRNALIEPAGRLRHTPAIRGHLATCAHCRAFDRAWGELLQSSEDTLRTTLRERSLPARLAARLAARNRPRPRFTPTLYLALPALAILLIIAALVLPGSTRQPVTIINRATSTPFDLHEQIAQALSIQNHPPDSDQPIWHARYQTFWYFDDNTVAPLYADIWLDRSNSARHRLQLSHTMGGAPYELQLGDGIKDLYYALDSLYAPTLYANLSVNATPGLPALLSQVADNNDQIQALNSRLSFGIWNIPNFYLQQAQAADKLSVLGHQRSDNQSVRIISFSGQSALEYPSGTPEQRNEQVTILLALDTDTSRLRSITELIRSQNGSQSSRVVWSLIEEQNLATNAAADSPFDLQHSWNGRGVFSQPDMYLSADLEIPLVIRSSISYPRQLLFLLPEPPSIPVSIPTGIDRAVLIWNSDWVDYP
ncbi:MAG: hypothetical protein HGA65_15190, partial [Oscillochloris sp.]|nr:hypothetical protein [Oscillochloris sp.]